MESASYSHRPLIVRAMRLEHHGEPLALRELELPAPAPSEVRIAVNACAVCRTDLHVVDGELPDAGLPMTPGHEIIGQVIAVGEQVTQWQMGDRVGVPWLGWACGRCEFCLAGAENLCPQARFTGYQLDGGYASAVNADARFVFRIPPAYTDEQAAPLMCAGLIGWRALQAAGNARNLGLYGFGAAAHIVAQIAQSRGQQVYAFVRPGDSRGEAFALSMGACWAGPSDQPTPWPLDAAIIFAPVGELVPAALRAVKPGGTVVCAGIHMSDIPAFPYALLWRERCLRSVANLTRRDADEFLAFAAQTPLRTATVRYPLAEANRALADLRSGALSGAAVLIP